LNILISNNKVRVFFAFEKLEYSEPLHSQSKLAKATSTAHTCECQWANTRCSGQFNAHLHYSKTIL